MKSPLQILTLPFLLIAPFLSFGQNESSPDITWRRCVALYKQGKLDSVQAKVRFCKNLYRSMGSARWFYVCRDTFIERNGHYRVGMRILDPYEAFDGREIGEWQSFYPGGQLCSKGSYGIGAYNICQGEGPGIESYSFREKKWSYWYENGHKMGEGVFSLVKKPAEASINRDTLFFAVTTAQWQFYDKNGNKLKNSILLADSINNDQYRKYPY